MELEGTIGTFSLRELIEMIVYSSVAGVLEVGEGTSAGQLYFRDGLPYDAQAGGVSGLDAAALLFECEGLPFRFVAGSTSAHETLWMDPWELMDRCEERARVWAGLRPYIPGLDWVPVLRSIPAGDQVHISEVAWPVLSAVDGQRSVLGIGEYLSLSNVEVCQALVGLLRQRLIILQPPPEPPETPVSGAGEAAQGEGGFFERLIAKTLEEERRRTSDPSLQRTSDPDRQRTSQSDLRPRVGFDER
ncbi:MAG: hypothetical protein RLZZ387_5187 [Chloroflexota bacterium]